MSCFSIWGESFFESTAPSGGHGGKLQLEWLKKILRKRLEKKKKVRFSKVLNNNHHSCSHCKKKWFWRFSQGFGRYLDRIVLQHVRLKRFWIWFNLWKQTFVEDLAALFVYFFFKRLKVVVILKMAWQQPYSLNL